MNPNRIVVGVDGSPGADQALVWAAEEARIQGAVLDVVHAWSAPMVPTPIGLPVPAPDAGPREVAAKELVERVVERQGIEQRVDQGCLRTHALQGPAAAVLLECARDAELLVVGSGGHGGFTGLLVGSVGLACATHSPSPVTVVRGTTVPRHDVVTVGVDGSDGSYRALVWGAKEAASRGAALWVVYAPGTASVNLAFGPAFRASDLETMRLDDRRMVDEMVARMRAELSAMPPVVRVVAADGTARTALFAATRSSDVVVVGSRGRGGFAGLLLGSVSQWCIHHAACPVTVVPSTRARGG